MTTTVFLYDPTTATDHNITSEVYSVEINRGRNRELDEINAGTCVVRCRNYLGNFNPYFLSDADYLLLESGDFLLLEDGGRIVLEAIGNGGSYGIMTVGRKLTVKDGSTTVFTGFLEDVDLDWRSDRYKDATLICADGLARLARQKWIEWNPDAHTTGDAVQIIYSFGSLAGADFSWAASASIDDGQSQLAGRTVAHGTNVLTDLQDISRAEQGRLFVTRSNVFRFQDRLNAAAGTAVVDFRDDATGQVAGKIPFSVVGVTFGSELLYTKVSANIVGGEPQTADDAIAQVNYGVRHLVLSDMLMDSDGQAADLAQYLVTRYASPEAVVSEIHVPLEKLSSANRTTVTGMEIGNTVTMNWTPTPGLGSVSQTLVVEGVGYQKAIDGATWMTFQLSAAASNDFFLLDDATHGVLDTSTLGF